MPLIVLRLQARLAAVLVVFCLLCGSLLSAQGSAAENGPNLTGRWVGTWDQPAAGKQRRDHRGSLRVRLRPVGPGQYRGVFAGRFAVVIPYIYRADVYQYGHTITSTRRLGPLGNYSMNLRANGNSLRGGWSAMGYRGNIQLQRR